MKAYTNVSRKTVGEDRVAICPNFGCEYMTRVKPLKLRFLGFGKHPKCKKHYIPLVYVNERIGDFVDAALACFFDKAGLPPSELLEGVKSKFPIELESFVKGWIYCIKLGRGAPIVSRYMDAISNGYLKQLTKKQVKALKKGKNSNTSVLHQAIRSGLNEIAKQYTRLLKHLRVHSEILSEHENLKQLSKNLRNTLKEWQRKIMKYNDVIKSLDNKTELTLKEIKYNYDQILNIGTCRSLLGLNPDIKEIKKAKITAFDRYSAYFDFYTEGLTSKFTKSDVINLIKGSVDLLNCELKENESYDSMKQTNENSLNNLSVEDLVQTYGNKLKKIIPKLIGKLDLRGTYAPTLKQLNSEGYKVFTDKIIMISKQNLGFNYVAIVVACGLRLKKKWDLYNFDDLGQCLLFDIDTLDLPKGFAPRYCAISWLSYVFPKRQYSYKELCSKYGLKLISGRDKFKDRKNYTMDDWINEYRECRRLLIEKELQTFESDEGPNTEDFSKKCNFCNTFYVATRRARLNVVDIGMTLGFFPRNPKRSYKEYTLRDYAKLLKEELDSGLKKELGLCKDEAPRLNSLKRKRSWMWAAILRSDFLYTEIVRTLNLRLYLDDVGLRGIIGNYVHEIIGSKIIEYTRSSDILSFKEVLPSKIDNLNVIDTLLIRYDKDSNFINKIEKNQDIILFPTDIHLICIDITISRDVGYIKEKFYKGYQGAGKFLIIVVFENRFTNISIPPDVKFRNNIKIISVDDFVKFISPNNKKLQIDFRTLVELVKSINKFDDESFRILEDLYRNAKRRLKSLEGRYNIRHKELEKILKREALYNLLRMPKY